MWYEYSEERELVKFHARIGENIKGAREARKCSQNEIAGIAGLSQSQLSRIEAGERGASLYALSRIAKALKVRPGDLMEGNTGKPRSKI